MTAHVSAPSVALSKPRGRPGLALLLAVLGVPGVTIAWDLPKGGYWIGLPLAVAAIVLGVRAIARNRPVAVAAIVLASIEILFTLSWTIFG